MDGNAPQEFARNSRLYCPNKACRQEKESPKSGALVRNGFFYRKSDRRRIRRFRCLSCRKSFSGATSDPCFGQKKRHLNGLLWKLLDSNVSMRRAARHLGIHRETVARKLVFLSIQSQPEQARLIQNYIERNGKFTDLQFDELETIEHTKCKPISVPLVVDARTRLIIGIKTCSMPAKGPLAAISRKKYGKRPCHRRKTLRLLFQEIAPLVANDARFKSDSHPFYPDLVKQSFPEAQHVTVISRRGCVSGQGELKKIGHDPLFALNHSCAMLRANVCRLIRRTWCTTKRMDRLLAHLQIYIVSHNRHILQSLQA